MKTKKAKTVDVEIPVGQVEIEDLINGEPEVEGEVVKHKKVNNVSPSEAYGTEPLEDRYGNDLWIRTKQCGCPDDADTDCRFHSEKEPGWEVCPYLEASKKDRKIHVRWLWARNPQYGKAPEITNES